MLRKTFSKRLDRAENSKPSQSMGRFHHKIVLTRTAPGIRVIIRSGSYCIFDDAGRIPPGSSYAHKPQNFSTAFGTAQLPRKVFTRMNNNCLSA